MVARAKDFPPEASSDTGLQEGKLALSGELWRYFSAPRCDGWNFPERNHREISDVVAVDCERLLWQVVGTGRTDTGCWAAKSGW